MALRFEVDFAVKTQGSDLLLIETQIKSLSRSVIKLNADVAKLSKSLRQLSYFSSKFQAQSLKVEKSINRVSKATSKNVTAINKNAKAIRRSSSASKGLSKANLKASKSFSKLRGNVAQVSATFLTFYAAISVVKGAWSLGNSFIDAASELESLDMSLKALSSTSEQAKTSFDWVKDFSLRAPLDIKDLGIGIKKALAYGLETSPDYLEGWADTASAIAGKSMDQVVDAIADAIVGENERLKEFGVKAKTSLDEVTYRYTSASGKAMKITVANNRKEIEKTLNLIYKSKFAKQSEVMANTWAGQVTLMKNKWLLFQAAITKDSGVVSVLKGVVGEISKMIDKMEVGESTSHSIALRIRDTASFMASAAASGLTFADGLYRASAIFKAMYESGKMLTSLFVDSASYIGSFLDLLALGFNKSVVDTILMIKEGFKSLDMYANDVVKRLGATADIAMMKLSWGGSSKEEEKKITDAMIKSIKRRNEIIQSEYDKNNSVLLSKSKDLTSKIADSNMEMSKKSSDLGKDFSESQKNILSNVTDFLEGSKVLQDSAAGMDNLAESIKKVSLATVDLGKAGKKAKEEREKNAAILTKNGAVEDTGQGSKSKADLLKDYLTKYKTYFDSIGDLNAAGSIAIELQINELKELGFTAEEVAATRIKAENDLYITILANRTDLAAGFERYMIDVNTRVQDMAAVVEDVMSSVESSLTTGFTSFFENTGDAMSNFFDKSSDGFHDFSELGKGIWDGLKSATADMLKTFLEAIQQMITKMLVLKTMQAVMGSSGIGGSIAGAVASYDGNVFSGGNVIPSANGNMFSNGGVVSAPSYFDIGTMSEKGPEAIMPLKRGSNGKLGVEVSGGSGGTVVNVNNYASASVSTSTRADGGIDIKIIDKQLANMAKSGRSALDKTTANKYAINKR